MSRAIAISTAIVGAFGLACAGPSASTPSEPAPTPSHASYGAPDGPPPPMYKPSSRSAAPMPITDPAYGASKSAPDAPGLGAEIPDFEVALADGGVFSLSEARGAGPVLIMFYRGFW